LRRHHFSPIHIISSQQLCPNKQSIFIANTQADSNANKQTHPETHKQANSVTYSNANRFAHKPALHINSTVDAAKCSAFRVFHA
jgi:hypothetical protein